MHERAFFSLWCTNAIKTESISELKHRVLCQHNKNAICTLCTAVFQTDVLCKRADSIGILHRDVEVNTDVRDFDLDLPVKMQICCGQRHEDKMSKWRFEGVKWCGPTARSVLKQI